MKQPKRRTKKRITITRDVAVRRVDAMVGLIRENVEIALAIRAAFQSANDIVSTKYKGGKSYEAHCYHVVMNSLALNLALALARLFDSGSRRYHKNKRDTASIPHMLDLLRQARLRKFYRARAREWTPHLAGSADTNAAICDDAIRSALDGYAHRKTEKGRKAVKALRQFRDKRLAHSLMDIFLKSSSLPKYGHLFLLTDIARDVAGDAKLAVLGDGQDLKDAEKEFRRQADAFWSPSLEASFKTVVRRYEGVLPTRPIPATATRGIVDVTTAASLDMSKPWRFEPHGK